MSYSWTGLDPVMVMRAARQWRSRVVNYGADSSGYKLFKDMKKPMGFLIRVPTLELYRQFAAVGSG